VIVQREDEAFATEFSSELPNFVFGAPGENGFHAALDGLTRNQLARVAIRAIEQPWIC
jgi:hypothetical protein